METAILAIDLGASNGRGMIGQFDGRRLSMEEVYRFGNNPMRMGQGVYWNYLQLYQEILNALIECRRRGIRIDCIGIDSWAQDYALISKDGRVLGAPHSYRDARTQHAAALVEEKLPGKRLFEITGMSGLTISTLHQLACDQAFDPETYCAADRMLYMPSLFIWLLCGEMVGEGTLPSLGHLLDIRSRTFSGEIAEAFDFARLLPPMEEPGKIVGRTGRAVLEETGYDAIPIALVGSHDTASAIAAIPEKDDFLFISSGTWSMMGITGSEPFMNDEVYQRGLYNTLAANGKIALMQGITGMYVIQQCMREWKREGREVGYSALDAYAETHEGGARFDMDALDTGAASMTAEVCRCIREAGESPPANPEEYYLALVDSLADKYAKEIAGLEAAAGRRFDTLHIVGGGAKATALNAAAAKASGKRVAAGQAEATAAGNMLCQLKALGRADFEDAGSVLGGA